MTSSAQHSMSALSPTGYHGKYLRVDLSTAAATSVPIDDLVYRNFLGGTGLGVYLLLREQQPSVDPLTEQACLAFVFSPLVGSPLTTSAKFAVVCKSPLTDRYNDSLASSGFAISGKKTGFDAIVVRGRADKPSILVIDNGNMQLMDAKHVWGLSTSAAEKAILQQLGADYRLAVIGPAGEQRVRFATISHDGRHAGRGGTGAVLGAKNIKAVAVRGSQLCRWADVNRLTTYSKQLSALSMGPATAKYRELGTVANFLAFNRLKTLPTRNFRSGSFAGAEKISGEALRSTMVKTRATCAACTIGCEHIYSAEQGQPNVRMEYENLFALGSLCGIDDPKIVLEASHRCDEFGIDTISAGGTIALAMDCVEHGWLDEPWLRFGNGQALLRALEMTATRQGVGEHLAEGSRHLEQFVGPKAAGRAAQVKGLELPGYEPRGAQAMAIGFAVGARGADHNRSGAYEADFSDQVDRRHATERSVELAIDSENRAALIDSLILCKFLRGVFDDLYEAGCEMLEMTCGWSPSRAELVTTAERIVAAKKLFNILAGWQPDEDGLPDRFLTMPLEDDEQASLPRERLESLVKAYYLKRNWSDEGWITDDELRRLELTAWLPQNSSAARDKET